MSNSAQPASAPDALIADLKNWAALFLKDEWETLPSHLNQADDALSAQQKRIAALEQDVTCAEQYSAKVLSDNVDKDLRIAELSAAEANYLHFKSECAKRDKRIAELESMNAVLDNLCQERMLELSDKAERIAALESMCEELYKAAKYWTPEEYAPKALAEYEARKKGTT